MTITLALFRHGEAAPDAGRLGDHQRPLTGRGKDEACSTGKQLLAVTGQPDLVLVSDALRAQETAAMIRTVTGFAQDVMVIDPGLYLVSAKKVANLLAGRIGPSHRVVWVVGHNPGLSEGSSLLSGRALGLSTGSAAVLVSEDEWPVALGGEALFELKHHLRP